MTTTSLTADLRRGDETQVLMKLQEDGIGPDDFTALKDNGVMRAEVVAAILRHRLFTSPEDQIRRMLEVNERVWKDGSITEVAIRAAGNPPACPASDEYGLHCVTLVSETGNALRTFERNWAACVAIHTEQGTWKWDGLAFMPKGVKQRDAAKPRPVGLRWVIAELGRAHKGTCVRDARSALDKAGVMGMGQELPGIAFMHPRWATTMNGGSIPFVDAPDLEVAPNGQGGFACAPYLYFDRGDGTVGLGAGRGDDPNSNYGSGSLQ